MSWSAAGNRRSVLIAIVVLCLSTSCSNDDSLAEKRPPIAAPLPTASSKECAGTPAEAATILPPPLNRWGELICTPYGHMIAAKEGWIWTRPGAFSPVYIPAQMVRENPAVVGNQAYFKEIQFTAVDAAELKSLHQIFQKVFPTSELPPRAYRLEVTSNSGRSLRLYFLDYEAPWGLWCHADGECDSSSMFMILDMTKPRNTR